jgi:hypothetical protein
MSSKILLTGLLLILFTIESVYSQQTIASWNFNNFSKNPQIGSGTLTTIGGVTEDWTRTGINPGLSIPAGLAETEENKSGVGFQTLNYPAQGTNAKTAGIQVMMSTVGYKNLIFSADLRQGGTSANKLMLQYTLDGINWERAVTYTTDNNDTWYLRNYNFSNIAGVNNNPLFGIRMVTNFDDDITEFDVYVPVRLASAYATTGPIRFDNITFRGVPLSTADDNRTPISIWNFDNLTTNPSTGSGTLSLIGGVSTDWTKSGIVPNQTIAGEGVYDVAALKAGAGMQTLNYPTLGNANKSAGIQINVNTSGYKDIIISADVRHGNTSANNMFIQYTLNGVNWIDAQDFKVNSGDTWYKKYYDFSNITAVNNNPAFGVRYVTAFDGLVYVATGFEKIYATTGPIRFDNVSIKGNLTASTSTPIYNTWKIVDNHLCFDELPAGSIRIFNFAGQLIEEFSSANSVSLANLKSGIYVFRTSSITGKFIR